MKRILVPCDFSKTAIEALRSAVDIAAVSKGTIDLLHVIELPVITDPVLMPVRIFEQDFLQDLSEKATLEFDKLISKYGGDTTIRKHIEFGPPARKITEFAAENDTDIIVMGSHGAAGLREIFVGSNAEKIVRNSSVPVLVIKKYQKRPVKNIVFPNTLHLEDMQDFTMKIKALQAFFKASIHIVYINTPTSFQRDAVTIPRLQEFARRFMFKDFTINVYNHASEEDGILEYAESVKGDLIAMGTHGRKGLSHLINGSMAENIVNHAHSAIWTYNLKQDTGAV